MAQRALVQVNDAAGPEWRCLGSRNSTLRENALFGAAAIQDHTDEGEAKDMIARQH